MTSSYHYTYNSFGFNTSIEIHWSCNKTYDLHVICGESDSSFPNHHPDPAVKENMVMLQNAVKNLGADVGIAHQMVNIP